MEQALKKTKTYDLVDIIKVVCSILIVESHARPFETTNPFADYFFSQYLARYAVAFFFITSGFFIAENRKETVPLYDCFLKYAGKMLRLYLIWTAIYLPVTLYSIFIYEGGAVRGLLHQMQQFFFVGSVTHLWYIHAAAVGCLLIALLLKSGVKIKIILLIGILFYVLGMTCSTYSFLFSRLIPSGGLCRVSELYKNCNVLPKRGLEEGLLFLTLGVAAAQRKEISHTQSLARLIISSALFFTEIAYLYSNGKRSGVSEYIFLPFAAYELFCFSVCVDIPHKPIYRRWRTLSSLVYFTHIFVLLIVKNLLRIMNCGQNMLLFVLTLLLSFVVSELIMMLSEKERFAWMKKIYRG